MPDGTLHASTGYDDLPGTTPFAMPCLARKGRGAGVNPPVRFERTAREAFDDGWRTLEDAFGDLPPLATTLTRDPPMRCATSSISPSGKASPA